MARNETYLSSIAILLLMALSQLAYSSAACAASPNCADFEAAVKSTQAVDDFVNSMRTKFDSHRSVQFIVSSNSISSDKFTVADESRKIWLDKSGTHPKFRDEKTRSTTWGRSKKLSASAATISDGEYVYQVGDLSYDPQPLRVVRHLGPVKPDLVHELVWDHIRQAARRLTQLPNGQRAIEACFDGSSYESRRQYIFDERTGVPAEGSERWNTGSVWTYKVHDVVIDLAFDPNLFRYSVPVGTPLIDKVPEETRMKGLMEMMQRKGP